MTTDDAPISDEERRDLLRRLFGVPASGADPAGSAERTQALIDHAVRAERRAERAEEAYESAYSDAHNDSVHPRRECVPKREHERSLARIAELERELEAVKNSVVRADDGLWHCGMCSATSLSIDSNGMRCGACGAVIETGKP